MSDDGTQWWPCHSACPLGGTEVLGMPQGTPRMSQCSSDGEMALSAALPVSLGQSRSVPSPQRLHATSPPMRSLRGTVRGWGGKGLQGAWRGLSEPFFKPPPPPPDVAPVTGGGTRRGVWGTQTCIPQNDHHDTLIIFRFISGTVRVKINQGKIYPRASQTVIIGTACNISPQ